MVLADWCHQMVDSPLPAPSQSRLVLGVVTGVAALWTTGVVVAPWLTAHGSVLGGWLRLLYRPGCHQIANRCLDLGFGPLAVCARCAGLYVGGTLALVYTLVRNRPSRPRPLWFAVVAAPNVIDFAAGLLGLPSMGNWSRFVLAGPLGFFAGLYLGDALIEIVRLNTVQNDQYTREDSVG
jgi:uncharacterized membrane protein